jgi:hypothetical protein
MGLIDIIKRGFRRTPKLSDRDRIRGILIDESMLAHGLARFLQVAVNNGKSARIRFEVDGSVCEVGIVIRSEDDLMEYLANWACAKSMQKKERLEEFDKGGGGVPSVSGIVGKGDAADLGAIPKNGGMGR